jgi:hypothetical protein
MSYMDTKSNLYRLYLVRTIDMLVNAAMNSGDHWLTVESNGPLAFGKVSDVAAPNGAIMIKEYSNEYGCNCNSELVSMICMVVIDRLANPVVQYVAPVALTDAEKEVGFYNKIGSIKMIRERTRLGLKDARDSFGRWWADEGYKEFL